MKLPLLISVPHAGLVIPAEVKPLISLTHDDIVRDGDEGAGAIYDIANEVLQYVTTPVARAIVDMNRAPDDRRKDGIVKTHTCWDVPVYRTFPDEATIIRLIQTWHHPYHTRLSRPAADVILGVDCHTMAAQGPPVGPDSGQQRPAVCLSNGDGTCSPQLLASLAACFERAFQTKIFLNNPFTGGYIIRRHSKTMPWVQLELSRAPFAGNAGKRSMVLSALREWHGKHLDGRSGACEGRNPQSGDT